MKLRPILRAETDDAVSLLAEGFPVHSRRTWRESVCRLFDHVDPVGDTPIGYIASANGADVGIGLAIPGIRSAYENAPRKVVNLAAFYMRPGNEWMTTLFLRRMMKDSSVEYVDVTASVAMRAVNRKLGFVDRTRGVVVAPTALTALCPSGGTRLIPFERIPTDVLSPEHMKLLEQHHRLAAISLAVEVDGVWHPMILVKNYRKRVVGARVVLARDTELVRRLAGPLARHLLTLGILFIEFDSPAPVRIAGSVFVTRAAPVQSTHIAENGIIDHTFSEFMFIPPPSNRPILEWPRRRNSQPMPLPFGIVDASITAGPTTGVMLSLVDILPL
ncbi:hypothetical protein [Rhizobium sp.]